MSKWILGLALLFPSYLIALTYDDTPVAKALDGVIVFDSNVEGNFELYIMEDNGRSIRKLTNDPAFDTFPVLSPDGKWVLWQSSRSPKPKGPEGHYDLYIMDTDGKNVRNLTNTADISEGHACWSPDGKRIAFTYAKEGADQNRGLVAVINADGTGEKMLTEGPVDGLPNCSPDGAWIVFDSARDGNHEIYKMKSDGSEVTRLTDQPALDSFPAWSPDGKTIAFHSERGEKGISEIYLMDSDGKNVRKLAEGHAIWPSWSPDGKRIAFMSARNGGWDIFTIGVDGKGVDQLTRMRSLERHPNWGRVPVEPSLAPGQVRMVSTVTGLEWVYSEPGKAAFNPQKYPLAYQGKVILDKSDRDALVKGGVIEEALAKKLVSVFSQPDYTSDVSAVALKVEQGKVSGTFTLDQAGINGKHKRHWTASLSGSVTVEEIHLKATVTEMKGAWQWGATEAEAAPLTGAGSLEAMTVSK